MAAILDYKPIEMVHKLDALFREEFDRISHYDLVFYAEITKDLLTVFKETDEKNRAQELDVVEESTGSQEESKEEEKKEEASTEAPIDPAKLAAMMLKQQAALKKAAT